MNSIDNGSANGDTSSIEVELADVSGVLENGEVYQAENIAVSGSSEIALDEVSGGTVTISSAGTYRLYGNLEGMVIIDASKDDDIILILDGVSINSASSAAIYVKQSGDVSINLAEGSINTLSNGGEYIQLDSNNIDAVIFSKSDLSLGGEGKLTISAAAGHGIVSKDTLEIYGGTYDITAASHGLSAKDNIGIESGTMTIVSGKDGIHAENADDASLGFVYIKGGVISITSDGDGISASGSLQIDSLDVTITAGGGAENAAVKTSADVFGGGRFSGWGGTESSSSDATDSTVSTKAIKSSGDMLINGGTYTINSADDAIHSNSSITINDGIYEISTGDDAVHADSALIINGGTMQVLKSYEGLEAQTIDITGGKITVKASDDGINVSGGADGSGYGFGFGGAMEADSSAYLKISGGELFIDADGDGLDSNGSIIVTGGEVYVAGPTNSGNGALDYANSATISGGTVIAVGATGMATTFGTSSTQGSIMINTGSQSAGTTVTLTDASGNVLAEHTFSKSYQNVVISAPSLTNSGTYTLTAGTFTTQITMTSISYSSSGGVGGMGNMGNMGGMGNTGNMGGGKGNRGSMNNTGDAGDMSDTLGMGGEQPQDFTGTPPEMPEMP